MNQRQWRLLLPPLVFGVVSFIWSVHITSTPPHDDGFIISAARISSSAGEDGHRPMVFYASPQEFGHASTTNANTNKTAKRLALEAEWSALGTLDPMLRVSPGEEVKQEYHHEELYEHGDCIPMQRWQTHSYPNCNSFHELSMMAARLNSTNTNGASMQQIEGLHVHYLGKGSVRTAWKVDFGSGFGAAVVLKTLNLRLKGGSELTFSDLEFESNRKDALAMERLSSSPYVIDTYGFCGQSALNELASNFDLKSYSRKWRGQTSGDVLRQKLKLSIMLAKGVAHIHEIDGRNNATMVHYDLKPENVLIFDGHTPKLSDFNMVEFLQWDRVKRKRCGLKSVDHMPWYRAPEELIMRRSSAEKRGWSLSSLGLVENKEDQPQLDEKVDVWSLGHLIYETFTGNIATKRPENLSMRRIPLAKAIARVREDVLQGKTPWDFGDLNGTHPAAVAMGRAITRCFVMDPRKRWSAKDVAEDMAESLERIEGNGQG